MDSVLAIIKIGKNLYFDHAAKPLREGDDANPNSHHRLGRMARGKIDSLIETIRTVLSLPEEAEIHFNSGAAEGNCQAIEGLVMRRNRPRKPCSIVVSAGSHSSVLRPARRMEQEGVAVCEHVNLQQNGEEDVDELKKAVREGALLLSIPLANNETGVVCHRLPELYRTCRIAGCLLHVDLSAAVGKIPIVPFMKNMNLGTMSAAKLENGPEEFGVLFIRDPREVSLRPLIPGSGGRRGGTPSVRRIEQFTDALEASMKILAIRNPHQGQRQLQIYFERKFKTLFGDDAVIFGETAQMRLPNISFCSIRGVKNLPEKLFKKGVCFSTAAACTAFSDGVSHVLRAMGVSENLGANAMRFSFSKDNNENEIDELLDLMKECVKHY